MPESSPEGIKIEVSKTPTKAPTLEKLVPNPDDPYIILNFGHTRALKENDTLKDIFKGYIVPEDPHEGEFQYTKISNRDLPKLFASIPDEEKGAFQGILKQELHAGKMPGLIRAYESRAARLGQPDITQTEVEDIRKLAVEALRQQHAVSNLPYGIIPDGVRIYTIDELEEAARIIDNADKSAEVKGIVFAPTESN